MQQQADHKAIKQINFTANLDRTGNTRNFFIVKEVKETVLDFSEGTVKVLQMFINMKWLNIIV